MTFHPPDKAIWVIDSITVLTISVERLSYFHFGTHTTVTNLRMFIHYRSPRRDQGIEDADISGWGKCCK